MRPLSRVAGLISFQAPRLECKNPDKTTIYNRGSASALDGPQILFHKMKSMRSWNEGKIGTPIGSVNVEAEPQTYRFDCS